PQRAPHDSVPRDELHGDLEAAGGRHRSVRPGLSAGRRRRRHLHPGRARRRQPGRPGVHRGPSSAGEAMIRWIVAATLLLAQETPKEAPRVSFNRDIRPILSQYCFACHGPDRLKAESDLRLDTREGALAAIVPGKPAESELIRRLTTSKASQKMPPRKTGKTLDARQVALLRTWIEQGAPWESPWALTTPKKPALPAVRNAAWVRRPLDRFVLSRLEAEGLRPAPEADGSVLLRRVSFDLTGLPPTVEEVDAFLADAAPDAYERTVDRLLASP